jgi:hypothetical protein
MFGREGYSILIGRIAMPTLVAQAASPSIGVSLLNILLVLALIPFALRKSATVTGCST